MAAPTVILTNPAAALKTLRDKLLVLNATNRLLHFPHGQDGNLRIVGAAPDRLHRHLFDNNANGQPRHAPLVMIPVRINKGRLNPQTKTYEYTITYTGEDILPNLSLKEKLKQNFGWELPDLDEDTRPEEYLADVASRAKLNQPTWKVHRWITICLTH